MGTAHDGGVFPVEVPSDSTRSPAFPGRPPARGTRLRAALGDEARRLGFSGFGVARVRPFRRARQRGLRAIAQGRMAGMAWFTPERVDAAADLGRRYPWARSIVSLAFPYPPAGGSGRAIPEAEPGRARGRFAAYACLDGGAGPIDYHDLVSGRCAALESWLRTCVPDLRAKRFVDHGRAMDRAIAERAGVGFAGKSAALITPAAGSYVLLAEILLSAPLPPTAPSRRECGTCRACLAACPRSLVAPGVVVRGVASAISPSSTEASPRRAPPPPRHLGLRLRRLPGVLSRQHAARSGPARDGEWHDLPGPRAAPRPGGVSGSG